MVLGYFLKSLDGFYFPALPCPFYCRATRCQGQICKYLLSDIRGSTLVPNFINNNFVVGTNINQSNMSQIARSLSGSPWHYIPNQQIKQLKTKTGPLRIFGSAFSEILTDKQKSYYFINRTRNFAYSNKGLVIGRLRNARKITQNHLKTLI